MNTKYIFLAFTLLFSYTFQAQKITKINSKKVTSIYTFSNFSNNINNTSFFNKKLKTTTKDSLFTNIAFTNINKFSFNSRKINKVPSEFLYDFKRKQDKNLWKDFLLKNDPTLWPLHCPLPN